MPLDVVRDPILAADDGFDDAFGALADHHRDWAPVVADGGTARGHRCRSATRCGVPHTPCSGNVRQVRGLRAGGVIVEAEVAAQSPLVGLRVAEVEWPRDTLLVAVERGGTLVVPGGDLILQATDHVEIFSTADARAELERLLDGAAELVEVLLASGAVPGSGS